MNEDLFIALYFEHKDRTGHDVLASHSVESLSTLRITCPVCLYLDKIRNTMTPELRLICLVCGKDLNRLAADLTTKPESDMWENALVDRITAGYGSKYDNSDFLVGLCDECIKDRISKGYLMEVPKE